MSREKWKAVDDYFNGLFIGNDRDLRDTLRTSAEAGLPPISVSPSHGKMLHVLARSTGARRILEIGTLGGYSAIWLARALPPRGRLVTLEYDPKHARVAAANIARAGLSGVVDIRIGRAVDSLVRLASEGAPPFDLVFIDADKQGYCDYLELSLKLSRPGTLIIADNVVRNGAILDKSKRDSLLRGIRRFNMRLAADPRVRATAIQTVGSKGYDGFAMAVVTAGA